MFRIPKTQKGQGRADLPILVPPDYVNNYIFSANSERKIPVPEGAGSVIFSSGSAFYVKYNKTAGSGTAVIPVSDVTDGTGQEYCPVWRDVSDFEELSIITENSAVVTLSFFSV